MAELPAFMPRLTTTERRILHAVGFIAVCRIQDERMDIIVDGLKRDLGALDKAPPDRNARQIPHTEDLITVAKCICAAFRRRRLPGGAAEWMSTHIDASRISQRFHWAALCSLDGV